MSDPVLVALIAVLLTLSVVAAGVLAMLGAVEPNRRTRWHLYAAAATNTVGAGVCLASLIRALS